MLAEISRKIPIWDYDLSSLRFCGWIEVYEAEKDSSFSSFSTASTTATELITCESAKCPFAGRERKTCKGEKMLISAVVRRTTLSCTAFLFILIQRDLKCISLKCSSPGEGIHYLSLLQEHQRNSHKMHSRPVCFPLFLEYPCQCRAITVRLITRFSQITQISWVYLLREYMHLLLPRFDYPS